MIFLKINGLVLSKEKIKESDAFVYILTKNNGILKCFTKSLFKFQSKNLSIIEIGNFNRFFILTDNFKKFKIISTLPLKLPGTSFQKYPYKFLWALKIIKQTNILATPKFLWFILQHLENYLNQQPNNFSFWFLFQILKELGYEINLDNCHLCNIKIKEQVFFDNVKFLYCPSCKKNSYSKISQLDLNEAKKIKNLIKIPKIIPKFLKTIIKNQSKLIFQ